MHYLQDLQHLGYKIWSERTSNASDKMRYRVIESMHIRVELLYDHEGTSDWEVTQWLLTPTVDDSGKVIIKKIW